MNKTTQTLINTYVIAALSFEDALAAMSKAYAGDKLSPEDLKLGLAMAFVHHKHSYANEYDTTTGAVLREGECLEGNKKPSTGALRKQVQRHAAKIMGPADSNNVATVRLTAAQKEAYEIYAAMVQRAEAVFTKACGKDSAKVKKAMKARA